MAFRMARILPFCPKRILQDEREPDREQYQSARSGQPTNQRSQDHQEPAEDDQSPLQAAIAGLFESVALSEWKKVIG